MKAGDIAIIDPTKWNLGESWLCWRLSHEEAQRLKFTGMFTPTFSTKIKPGSKGYGNQLCEIVYVDSILNYGYIYIFTYDAYTNCFFSALNQVELK